MKGLLKTTMNSVSRLFGGGEEEAADRGKPPVPSGVESAKPAARAKRKRPAPKKPRIDSRETLAQMEQIIDRMVDKHGTAIAGRVQLLRFDELLSSVGPKRGERLERAIEGIARKYIGPADILRPMGGGVFVTIFGGVSQEEAEVKCAMIRDDVNRFAEGDPNLKGKLEVSTVVAAVDGGVKLQELESFDALFERLEDQKQETDEPARPAQAPEPEPGKVSAAAFDDWDNWLDAAWTAPDAEARPAHADEDDPKWRDIAYEGNALSTNPQAETVDVADLRAHLQMAQVVPRPIWDMDRKTLAGMACVPFQQSTGTALSGDAIGPNPSGVVTLSLDRLAVTWAGEQLAAPEETTVSPIVIPVHFASLASMRNRSLLFTTFLDFDPAWRARTLGEVSFPEDIYLTAVEDVVRLLAPFVGRLGVCCGLDWRYFANLRAWGVHWAGFSLSGKDPDDPAIMDDMANFAAGAREAGLVPYIKDTSNRNMVMAAAAVGIRNIFAAPDLNLGGKISDLQFRMEGLSAGS